jgi:hypothetical protein
MTALIRTRSFLYWFLSFSMALVAWRFLVLGVEASMAYVAYHAAERPLGFYAHVGFGPVALALAPFQFWAGLRARRPGLHRWPGRAYGLSILVAGMGGLAMALGTEAGAVASTGFAALAVLWLATTARGVQLAMSGRIAEHRRWMIRSAALTFAAVTLRLELPLLVAGGLSFKQAYGLVAWACWVPNLTIAEWMIGRRRLASP